VHRHLFPSVISKGAQCQSTSETSASEERKRAINVRGILPASSDFHDKLQGSLTCRKFATWDRRLYFPSEGIHAKDFSPENSDGLGRVRTRDLGSDGALWIVLARYGEVKNIQAETWSRLYRNSVANGIRLAMITLAKHIPSHITVAGKRVLVSYDGQPMTCYGCNDMGHLYQAYQLRRRVQETRPTTTTSSWADIAAWGVAQPFQVCEDKEDRVPHTEQPGHTATASEEQDELLSLEGKSGPFDDQMQGRRNHEGNEAQQ
jgi:hypothetical protein